MSGIVLRAEWRRRGPKKDPRSYFSRRKTREAPSKKMRTRGCTRNEGMPAPKGVWEKRGLRLKSVAERKSAVSADLEIRRTRLSCQSGSNWRPHTHPVAQNHQKIPPRAMRLCHYKSAITPPPVLRNSTLLPVLWRSTQLRDPTGD